MNQVTFLPILAAGIAAAIIGWIWYHPRVFGGVWMRLSGITPEMIERNKSRMPIYAFVALLAAMLVAYVMNFFGIAWNVTDASGAAELGFWCWAGFAAPPMLGMVLWEGKALRTYAIVAGYWLVTFIVIAEILLYGSTL